MKLSIIINHHRTTETLLKCLDALKREIKTVEYEIIVTDSEAEEGMAGLISRKYPDVLYVGNLKNAGFSKIVNPAIEKARGDYFFIINADIILKNEKSLIDMIDYLEKREDAGVVGPKLLNIDGSIQQSYFREYTPLTILARRTLFGKTSFGKKYLDRFSYKDKTGGLNEPLKVDWLMGSALLLERKRFEKIGGKFDERFFMYFEDADLCRRFREAGFKAVYYPSAEMTHYHAKASVGGKGIFDIFGNWLTRVHIASYLKYLWKWKIEWRFKRV